MKTINKENQKWREFMQKKERNDCYSWTNRIGIWICWFLRRGENRSTRGKPLGARERTNNKLNLHKASTPGVEPWLHWWEESAYTTAPFLAPQGQEIKELDEFIYLGGGLTWTSKSPSKSWGALCQIKHLLLHLQTWSCIKHWHGTVEPRSSQIYSGDTLGTRG